MSLCVVCVFDQPNTRAVVTLFTLTKALEFGDTVLLALRKRPITFLHAYHHLTVVSTHNIHTQAGCVSQWCNV